MPQFHPDSNFISQIFWLIICFAIFYTTMAKIFLPRIRKILLDRDNEIQTNQSETLKIQLEINDIEENISQIKTTTNQQYKTYISQSEKEASLHKEKGIYDLKEKIAKITKKSQEDIMEFKDKSIPQISLISNNLAQEISKKLIK